MSRGLGVAIPFWLDRPDEEAVDIAQAPGRVGIETAWVGEMADHVTVVPSTAEDPAGQRVLESPSTQPAVGT